MLNKLGTNKPFKVGLDMAKIAGFVETDSFIALSTWAESQPLNFKNSTKKKFMSKICITFIYLIHFTRENDMIEVQL